MFIVVVEARAIAGVGKSLIFHPMKLKILWQVEKGAWTVFQQSEAKQATELFR